jgi:tRNA uridine 5-carboxymethylaminomethyl modification enzyme
MLHAARRCGVCVAGRRRLSLPLPPSGGLRADVIIVGGGHAGCEAAAASARSGADTILVTQRLDTIGELSCNPSMGGIGKGHLVREIDALDGLMGKLADACGIHFKVLNLRKGPAVRGPRAQLDRDLYKAEMLRTLQTYPNLRLVEASVEDIQLSTPADGAADGAVEGVRVQGIITKEGELIAADRVVITTGTFLRGTIYFGQESFAAGRQLRSEDGNEPPSVGLALTLEKLKFPLGRLKTGTPPRLRGDSINWAILDMHPSDAVPQPFSHMNADAGVKLKDQLVSCAMTYTNEKTHQICMDNKHLLPIYQGGGGTGVGPRYCPSLYAKVSSSSSSSSSCCYCNNGSSYCNSYSRNSCSSCSSVYYYTSRCCE